MGRVTTASLLSLLVASVAAHKVCVSCPTGGQDCCDGTQWQERDGTSCHGIHADDTPTKKVCTLCSADDRCQKTLGGQGAGGGIDFAPRNVENDMGAWPGLPGVRVWNIPQHLLDHGLVGLFPAVKQDDLSFDALSPCPDHFEGKQLGCFLYLAVYECQGCQEYEPDFQARAASQGFEKLPSCGLTFGAAGGNNHRLALYRLRVAAGSYGPRFNLGLVRYGFFVLSINRLCSVASEYSCSSALPHPLVEPATSKCKWSDKENACQNAYHKCPAIFNGPSPPLKCGVCPGDEFGYGGGR